MGASNQFGGKMKILLPFMFLMFFCGCNSSKPVPPSPVPQPVKNFRTIEHGHKHHKGLKRHEHAKKFLRDSKKLKRSHLGASPIPKSISLRGTAGPVEDQGQCGSCWDFSLTTVLRGTMILANQDPGRLSFNYLLNCDTDDYGCNGGDLSAAEWLIQGGKGIQGDYSYDRAPYSGSQGKCVKGKAIAQAAGYQLLGDNNGPSFYDIASQISQNHPVSTDVAAGSGEWENYSGGVYNVCQGGENDIDHMVVIEGYDCEGSVDSSGNCALDPNGNLPPGIGTYLVRNSWGPWGDAGYITMKVTDINGNRCNQIGHDALVFELGDQKRHRRR
jgi:C1A family cysteine protease